jgi:hypothetical protein
MPWNSVTYCYETDLLCDLLNGQLVSTFRQG